MKPAADSQSYQHADEMRKQERIKKKDDESSTKDNDKEQKQARGKCHR